MEDMGADFHGGRVEGNPASAGAGHTLPSALDSAEFVGGVLIRPGDRLQQSGGLLETAVAQEAIGAVRLVSAVESTAAPVTGPWTASHGRTLRRALPNRVASHSFPPVRPSGSAARAGSGRTLPGVRTGRPPRRGPGTAAWTYEKDTRVRHYPPAIGRALMRPARPTADRKPASVLFRSNESRELLRLLEGKDDEESAQIPPRCRPSRPHRGDGGRCGPSPRPGGRAPGRRPRRGRHALGVRPPPGRHALGGRSRRR